MDKIKALKKERDKKIKQKNGVYISQELQENLDKIREYAKQNNIKIRVYYEDIYFMICYSIKVIAYKGNKKARLYVNDNAIKILERLLK